MGKDHLLVVVEVNFKENIEKVNEQDVAEVHVEVVVEVVVTFVVMDEDLDMLIDCYFDRMLNVNKKIKSKKEE